MPKQPEAKSQPLEAKQYQGPATAEPRTADDQKPAKGALDERASRIEPYSDGTQFGWRRVGQFGTVMHDSGVVFDSESDALDAAENDGENAGLSVQGRGPEPLSRDAWR